MSVEPSTSLRIVETEAAASASSTTAFVLPGDGDLLGRFILLKQIWSGAMGTVYTVLDPDLKRKVAIKFINPELNRQVASADERSKNQMDLLAEGQALARASHLNIVSVFEVGVLHDFVYVAMELVSGRSLRE